MLITESQRREILSLHNQYGKDIAIFEALSLNENYVIFLDELYDLKNKVHLGNLWESIDNIKTFINDSPNDLAESLNDIKHQINSLVLAEGVNSLRLFKNEIILLREQEKGFFDKVGDWAKQKGQEVVQGVKDTYQTVKKGVQDFAKNVSKGEVASAISIVGKGVVYLAKKLRDALYHPVGMILDAILVASGIGKPAQFVIWAIVVCLDIYELSTGDYKEEEGGFYGKLLFLGVDLIGLIFAGVAAKAANGTIANFIRRFGKNAETMKAGVAQTPRVKGIITQMEGAIKSVPGQLQKASQYLTQKSPKIGGWVAGILSKVGGFLKKITDFLSYLVVGTVKAGGKIIAAPAKAATKVAQKLGASAPKAAKIGAGTGAGVTTAGITYALDKPEQSAEISFADTGLDFENSL